jgi:hypothetical protein
LLTIVALAVAQLYSGWISGRKLTFTIVGDFGKATLSAVTLVFGLLSIIFFLSPANQLLILGNPPYLPNHFTTDTLSHVSAGADRYDDLDVGVYHKVKVTG